MTEYTLKKYRESKVRKDGWYNATIGLGKRGFDKNVDTYFQGGLSFSDMELTSIYAENGIGSRIINRPAADSVRRWFSVPDDPENKIINQLSAINAQDAIKKAQSWARLYGGAIIIMNTDDGRLLEEELIVNRVKEIKGLKVFSRPNIQFDYTSIDIDPESNTFEEPTQFTITTRYGSMFKVHRSRCLIFKGYEIPNIPNQLERGTSNTSEDWYWGISELYRVYTNLRSLSSSIQGISSILQEFVVSLYKIKDLSQVILQGNLDVLYDRMDIIHTSKSNLNGVFLDADGEDYQRNSAQLSGVDKVLEMLVLMLSGASGIPITLLFGRSPSGLNASGDSDIRLYYDDIASFQNGPLQHSISPLLEIAGLIAKIKNPVIEWNPLWEPSEKEKAEIRKVQADTDKIYIDSQVVGPEEVREMRFVGGYSDTMMVDEEEME